MPTRYYGTCSREGCENPLYHGRRFCSSECAMKDLRIERDRKRRERLPGDDMVWAHRARSWAWWGKQIGAKPAWVSKAMYDRGWRKEAATGRTTHAPCQHCGEPFPIEPEAVFRHCGCKRESVSSAVELFRKELKRRRPGGDRYHLMKYTTPSYTVTRFGKAPSKPGIKRHAA